MSWPDIKIYDIARVCHEVNRAYCQAIGDSSQSSWEESPRSIKDSAIAGVRFTLNNPGATPADQHRAWMIERVAAGWVHGQVKDPVAKVHPCLVSYEELPLEQRVKDHLFQAVVQAMR